MNYPIDKYTFYTDSKNRVIAVSTFAGKAIRGVACLNEKDSFDMETGKAVAAARCNSKVAHKRKDRAWQKYCEACDAMKKAKVYLNKMESYYNDSYDAMLQADNELEEILNNY